MTDAPAFQVPFRRMAEEKKSDSFTIWLNKEERELLEKCKLILEQSKDSTVLKELAWIGAKTISRDETAEILAVVFKNKRKNKRLGIVEFEV